MLKFYHRKYNYPFNANNTLLVKYILAKNNAYSISIYDSFIDQDLKLTILMYENVVTSKINDPN